jgi:hypothetical protein
LLLLPEVVRGNVFVQLYSFVFATDWSIFWCEVFDWRTWGSRTLKSTMKQQTLYTRIWVRSLGRKALSASEWWRAGRDTVLLFFPIFYFYFFNEFRWLYTRPTMNAVLGKLIPISTCKCDYSLYEYFFRLTV